MLQLQSSAAIVICTISIPFLFLILKSLDTALRSTRLLPFMDQPVKVDDQEPAPNDIEPMDEGIPKTSSEPEHHSGSEESK